MADTQRVRRVGEMIQREVALLLQREIKDPRVQSVTISAVKVNKDLSVARIYYTIIQSSSDNSVSKEDVQKGLDKASGFIRHLIGKQLTLRILPRLDFIFDQSIEHGAYMSNYIDQIVATDKLNSEND
ncbi:MAG: 30S ribosome-binding factor RbfA [Gammaproteobacteria bacterium]|nr:30S ribosome-binding factor RbfA [Gammaproteobacteria bacterium]